MQPTHQANNDSFPLWQFLTQPISRSTRIIFNPFRFWNYYNLQRLESCWRCDPVQLLERCWAKEMELENPSNR